MTTRPRTKERAVTELLFTMSHSIPYSPQDLNPQGPDLFRVRPVNTTVAEYPGWIESPFCINIVTVCKRYFSPSTTVVLQVMLVYGEKFFKRPFINEMLLT